MVLEGDLGHGPGEINSPEDIIPGLGMEVDQRPFHLVEPAGINQYLHRHDHLADIVEQAGNTETDDLIFG